VYPDAEEDCNAVDDDCDGSVDEDFDADGDGVTTCGPDGTEGTADDDCDDTDPDVYPGADEYCDGEDDDCDGVVDEDDAVDAAVWYEDVDGDGYGDPSSWTTACSPVDATWVGNADDCDDGEMGIGPDTGEICGDELDNNCDNVVDEGCHGCIGVPSDYGTIQAAIDSAPPGAEICVAPGTYPENLDFGGKDLRVFGTGGPLATIIDGGGTGPVVTFASGETDAAMLQSLTLTNGAATDGGGIHIDGASPQLISLIVTDCAATGSGGGIHATGGSPSMENLLVVQNEADQGGGIALAGWNATLTHVRVLGNTAASSGGGIAIDGGAPTLEHVDVVGNTATAWRGGGIYVTGSATPSMTSSSVSANASAAGGGIDVDGATLTSASNNSWNNTPANYGGIGDPTGYSGNISADPLYLTTASPDPLLWDLHLGELSHLVDGGVGNTTDPDGTIADIGAYGGAGGDDWDLDGDGYPEWWQPGEYTAAYGGQGWDCEDQDAAVYPGSGC